MGTHNGKILDPAHFLRNTKKQRAWNQRRIRGFSDDKGMRKSCSDFYVERGLGNRCPHRKHWTVISHRSYR